MKMVKIKKEIMIHFVILIACMLLSVAYGAFTYVKDITMYPQIEISKAELLGKNNSNLKDFNLRKDGTIQSTSEDPWIEYKLQHKTSIHEIDVNLDSLSTEYTWGQIFFVHTDSDWQETDQDISKGINSFWFSKDQNLKNIQDIRFDLTSIDNLSIGVKSITLNSSHQFLLHNLKASIMSFIFVFCIMQQILVIVQKLKKSHKVKAFIVMILYTILEFLIAFEVINKFNMKTDVSEVYIWKFLLMCSILVFGFCILQIEGKQESKLSKIARKVYYVFSIISVVVFNMATIELLGGVPYQFEYYIDGLLNLLLLFEILVVILLVTRRLLLTIIIINIPILILALINHYYMILRGEPFELADVKLAKSAATVLSSYQLEITYFIVLIVIIEFVMIFFVASNIGWVKLKFSKKGYVIGILQLFLAIIVVGRNLPDVGFWSITESSYNYGYVLSFCSYVDKLKIEKPKDYVAKKTNRILTEEATDKKSRTKEKTPNVIAIMNESFADLPAIYGFETEGETLPFIHSLNKNTIKGNLLVSVFGGTTANSEYEFLTGNSISFLPHGVVPYVGYINNKQESFAWDLKSQGYSIRAYHPYDATNYHRNIVYPYLGFPSFYSLEDNLSHTDTLRDYVSDKSDFKNIIDMYKARDKSKPFFVFNVTMQNHGGYSLKQSAIDVTVKPTDENLQLTPLEEYLSLIHESDAAFEELVCYFSKIDDDTIIIMFGDHQPSMDQSVYNVLDDQLFKTDASIGEVQKQFLSSYVIWANYDIGYANNKLISSNYLKSYTENVANMKMSNYDVFLNKLRQVYPALNINGFLDANGDWHSLSEMYNDELLTQYKNIAYQNLFDRKHMDWMNY